MTKGKSLGHQLIGTRSVFVWSKSKEQSKNKCQCLSCSTSTNNYKFVTSNKREIVEDFGRHDKLFVVNKWHLARARDISSKREFWCSLSCFQDNTNWRCACLSCKSNDNDESESESEYFSTKSESDSSEVEIIIRGIKNIKFVTN